MTPDANQNEAESLHVQTYRGDESLPWQFSARRNSNELIITQARGPEEKFDPVVKRFSIEEYPLRADPATFEHAVIRRVWSEIPDQPMIRSQRSEGHQIEFLYRDQDGWHLAQPDSHPNQNTSDESSSYSHTDLRGIKVNSTFLRSESDSESKYTEERKYQVSKECLDAYEEMYVLSYHEVNEESTENDIWKVENAAAYHLTLASSN